MPIAFNGSRDKLGAHKITIKECLKRVKNGKSKDKIEEIRRVYKEGGDYSELKKNLPSIIYAADNVVEVEKEYSTGKNKGKKYKTKRTDDAVCEHSGYFVLDFDNVDYETKKNQLKRDEYIFSAFVSPTYGVKALVKCPKDINRHSKFYDSFLDRYPELDSTSRNISRLCFESYDPDIYINPNSKVWDKVKNTQEQQQIERNTGKARRNQRVINICRDMIRYSVDGEKHKTLIKASNLAGGYIATGQIDEEEVRAALRKEIDCKPNVKNKESAYLAIDDGIIHGKSRPLSDAKIIEKEYKGVFKREDGEFDFIASSEEMNDYIHKFISGSLEMGLTTGIAELDRHWMVKKNHLVWWGGLDNVGKTITIWYIATLSAILHNWRFVIFSAENGDGQVKKKIMEFYLNKSVNKASEAQLKIANEFFDKHFKIVSSKNMYTWDELLLRGELIFDEGWEFDCLIAEPYNAMDIPNNMDSHRHNLKSLNALRVFKSNYCSVWVADHATTSAARDIDAQTGHVRRPWKASIEGGQLKANKTDDFIILHRIINDEVYRMDTRIYVDKVKDTETGGVPTMKDSPVNITANPDLCGYSSMGIDPIEKYWHKREEQQNLNYTREWT